MQRRQLLVDAVQIALVCPTLLDQSIPLSLQLLDLPVTFGNFVFQGIRLRAPRGIRETVVETPLPPLGVALDLVPEVVGLLLERVPLGLQILNLLIEVSNSLVPLGDLIFQSSLSVLERLDLPWQCLTVGESLCSAHPGQVRRVIPCEG